MGLVLVDQNADFSASAVGHKGLYTSLTTDLQALHEIRRSASKAINNAVPDKLNGSVIGSPTFSAANANVSPSASVLFGTKPASGGLTIAFIVKNKNGGSSSDGVVGSVPGTSTTQGGVYCYLFNRRLTAIGYTYASPASPPLSGMTSPTVFTDMIAADDGNYELFFVVLEDNVSIRIYRPKTATTATTSAVGRDFAFDGPPGFRTCPIAAGGAHDVAMFGHWSAVLTTDQMNTFYGEMQEQYAALGLTI